MKGPDPSYTYIDNPCKYVSVNGFDMPSYLTQKGIVVYPPEFRGWLVIGNKFLRNASMILYFRSRDGRIERYTLNTPGKEVIVYKNGLTTVIKTSSPTELRGILYYLIPEADLYTFTRLALKYCREHRDPPLLLN